MKTNEIVEIQSVLCDTCNGAGFVMLLENGDTQVLHCDCKNNQSEYFLFWEEND